jgi:malate synthase
VEITGPVDRKMMINAFNSGSERVHGRLEGLVLAEWENVIVRAAETCSRPYAATLTMSVGEKHYRLYERRATRIVRPRGWISTNDI